MTAPELEKTHNHANLTHENDKIAPGDVADILSGIDIGTLFEHLKFKRGAL